VRITSFLFRPRERNLTEAIASVFRYSCHTRADKLKKTSLQYGLLSKVSLEGGFIVVLMIRFSLIPPHCVYSSLLSYFA
jgi:hypothetical protein